MLKTGERAAGVIPRGNDDDAPGPKGAEDGDGQAGILLRGAGAGFQTDGRQGHPGIGETGLTGHGIASSRADDEGGVTGLEQFGGALRPLARIAAQHDDDVGLDRTALDGQHLLGQEITSAGGEQHRDGGEEAGPEEPSMARLQRNQAGVSAFGGFNLPVFHPFGWISPVDAKGF